MERITKIALAVGAAASVFIVPCMLLCQNQGPVVAIDLRTSKAANTAAIHSTYAGGADRIYAFLVIEDMPGGYVSGYHAKFDLRSSDSSVVNMGFHRLAGWVNSDPGRTGFPSDVQLPGQSTPAAIGFWELRLVKGSASKGEFRLENGLNGRDEHMVLLDGRGRAVNAAQVYSAYVNPAGPANGDSVPLRGDFTVLDCTGDAIPEIRTTEYVPGRVIARFVPGAIDVPEEVTAAALESIADPGVKRVVGQFGLSRVGRVYRHARKDDGEVMSRTGQTVTLLNVWDVYVLEFPAESSIWTIVDSLRSLPACVYAQPDLSLRLLRAPNDTLYRRALEPREWHIDRIQAPPAWDLQTGSPSVRIGIIDHGLSYGHPDLGGCIGPGCKVVGGMTSRTEMPTLLNTVLALLGGSAKMGTGLSWLALPQH